MFAADYNCYRLSFLQNFVLVFYQKYIFQDKYPAVYPAGYPAKTVSGASLLLKAPKLRQQ
jgi:hypothetical protein